MTSVEPLTSAKRTVTCLRSPSRAALEERIFSARYLGVWLSRATTAEPPASASSSRGDGGATATGCDGAERRVPRRRGRDKFGATTARRRRSDSTLELTSSV